MTNHLTPLKLSQELKELGAPQKSKFYWVKWKVTDDFYLNDYSTKHPKGRYTASPPIYDECSAYLASEIAERLPEIVEDNLDGALIQFELSITKPTHYKWDIAYMSPLRGKDILIEITAPTLVEALGLMEKYLRERGLMR